MKHLLLALLLTPTFLIGQTRVFRPDNQIYVEANTGIGVSGGKPIIPNFSTKDSGSGIGLAVAKRGIEHAGGKIYFKSKVGKGTTFFIEIPVIQAWNIADP